MEEICNSSSFQKTYSKKSPVYWNEKPGFNEKQLKEKEEIRKSERDVLTWDTEIIKNVKFY